MVYKNKIVGKWKQHTLILFWTQGAKLDNERGFI